MKKELEILAGKFDCRSRIVNSRTWLKTYDDDGGFYIGMTIEIHGAFANLNKGDSVYLRSFKFASKYLGSMYNTPPQNNGDYLIKCMIRREIILILLEPEFQGKEKGNLLQVGEV